MKCKYCGRICKNTNSLAQHELRCKSNPVKYVYKEKSQKWLDSMCNRKGIGTNHYTYAKRNNLPKPLISEETSKKLSLANKGKIWSEERRIRHRVSMKKAVLKYPESYAANNVCGRVKNIKINDVLVKGKWEYVVAELLNKIDIKWTNTITPFSYYWNNTWHLYFPDFYLPDYDIFVEVKGYERERDRCKWENVKNLKIIKNEQIKLIKNGMFDMHMFLTADI